jgi:hypothetical protein
MRFKINPGLPARPRLRDMKDGEWGVVNDEACIFDKWLVRCTRDNGDQQQGWHLFGPNGEHKVFSVTDDHYVDILPKGTIISITL